MRAPIFAALLGSAIASTSPAQSIATADSLLQRGNLERAESLYYHAVRVRPQDPVARWGLGRYVAGRGASRVAMTLFEEAIKFGGDATLISADLIPIYVSLWEYHSLLALPTSVVGAAERERARWLEAHPTRVVAPDSVMMAAYRDTSDAGYIGHMPIRINGKTVDALIAAGATGIVISDSVATATRLKRFPSRTTTARGGSQAALGAADSIGIARIIVTNYPLRVGSSPVPAVIGLDVLGKFAPTFDAQTGRVTLRLGGALPPGLVGERLSTWSTATDLKLVQGGGWISITNPSIAQLLRQRPWTLDAKHGHLIISR